MMAGSFDHVVILIFENATRQLVLENDYMNSLRKHGVFLENAYGLMHPSQPNYIALIGGDTFGFNSDDPQWVAPYIYTPDPNGQPAVTSIVDLIESKGLTWKVYPENMQTLDILQPPPQLFPPGPPVPVPNVLPPFPPIGPRASSKSDPLFARRHVPFLSFPSIVTNPNRVANLELNAQATFASDVASGQLPSYSWYIPNLINDGHSIKASDGSIQVALPGPQNMANIAAFLQEFLGADPIARFPPKTLIVITFDEAFPYTEYEIYTLLIGDMLPAGTSRHEPYNHYSLVRSIEDNFEIGHMGRNDAAAKPYWFLC
jgi:phospholipase C